MCLENLEPGDVVESDEGRSLEIIGRIGEIYFCLDFDRDARIYSVAELERYKYKKKEKEVPPDGTIVKVRDIKTDNWLVRVSCGEVQDGSLMCYSDGRFEGARYACGLWKEWEVV